MKYLKVFFVIFFSLSVNAQTLKLPEVSAEYVCNTKFIIGGNSLKTRTFQSKNKKRIDTVIQNIPQSVIIDYEKQIVTWIWPKTYSYLSSRSGDTFADKAIKMGLKISGVKNYKQYSYLERGSDERQFCSPGIDLPVCSFMRSKYHTYPEYHTSLDNFSFISKKGLEGSLKVLKNAISYIELHR